MGLFTELPLGEARRLGGEFGLEVASVEPLAAGSVNSNFRLLDTAGRRYFARIYEEQGRGGALAELVLLGELARAGVPTTVPLARSGGEPLSAFSGKPFAVYPWIDGEILCQGRVTPRHAGAVGAALARIHLASARVTPLAAGRFRPEDVTERLSRIERESDEHRAVARDLAARLRTYSARRDPDLPAGVVHGDLFRDNVLWQGDVIAALIDFESASHGPFAFDVMVTLLAWCYGDAFEHELVAALLAGYQAERPLGTAEIAALPVEGALACLRFGTTRITDFSMRVAPGQPPLRDYRRFLARLAELEAGALTRHFPG